MKLGPHIIRGTAEGIRWAQVAPIVKALDDRGPFAYARADAIRVYRRYFPHQDLRANAEDVARSILQGLGGYRHPRLYAEIYNEEGQRLGQGLEEHVELVRHVTYILHQNNVKVAGFSFSTGSPELEDWLYLKAHDFAGVDAIAIHEYWGAQGFSTWNALRYRRVHEWLRGVHPPFVITECGRDAVEGGGRGWMKSGISADEYIAELIAYSTELERDSYVLGATVFTAGPTPDWADFNTDPISDRLTAIMPPPPPPVPPPPPPPPPQIVYAKPGSGYTFINVRSAPNLSSGSDLGDIPAGQAMHVEGEVGAFYKITAYVAKRVTSTLPPRLPNALQLVYPVKGRPKRINHPYGEPRSYGKHEGVDLYARDGDEIVPCLDGVVDGVRTTDPGRGYGIYVRVYHDLRATHGKEYRTWYGHLREARVKVGDQVKAGKTVLGLADSTGNSTGTHLHLTLQQLGLHNGMVVDGAIDPAPYL